MGKKSRIVSLIAIVLALVLGIVVIIVIKISSGPKPGSVVDEAMTAGLTAADLPGSSDDYLRNMDRGWGPKEVHQLLAKTLDVTLETLVQAGLSEEVVWDSYNRGRNNWIVWSAGNDRFWDFLANNTFGAFDLLKTLSSHPSINYCGNKIGEYGYGKDGSGGYAGSGSPVWYPEGYNAYEGDDYVDEKCEERDNTDLYQVSRDNRWKYLGLVNEPGFKQWQPSEQCKNDPKPNDPKDIGEWCGDPERWGLWLDKRVGKPDPFENGNEYPGVKIGARGETDIHGREFSVGSYYGYGTGIVGLRLFPNPDFDKKAQKKWDPWRYYNDEKYYQQKDLVRPYRVGMSCGFCHVGPSPINHPADPENPEWRNLTSNPGAQYYWVDRIFFWNPKLRHQNFIYQLFHTSLPGSLDTSLVSSDNINNPRTMNAVYSIAARLKMVAKEKLTGGELNNKQFNDYERTRLLSGFFEPPDTVFTPHVLKDGADSVGVLGALNRVYINIGLFSEEWLLHFRPLIGNIPGKRITPIEIAVSEKNSTYWNANVAQTPDLALFFLISALPDRLSEFPEGQSVLKTEGDLATERAGFEDHPQMLSRGKTMFAQNCARCHSGKQPENICRLGSKCESGDIIENTAAYFEWMWNEVQKVDFLENNFLSTEVRIPVTELGTNACSPLGTNGLRGDIWDNFTSTTYKELPAVGKVTVHHPKTGEPWEYEMPGGGRGYTRPASLISLWSTAPFLLNNSVGNFYGEASLEARMKSFNDSIQKMLWPETRRPDDKLKDIPGYIQRTTARSYLKVPEGYLPKKLQTFTAPLSRFLPFLFDEEDISIGPFPKGMPVGLLANLPLVSDSTRRRDKIAHIGRVVKVLIKAKKDLKEVPENVSEAELEEIFADLIDPLVGLSKCPDYVVNRGHYFGSNLSDKDKWALIEFLKTF
jgi:hypothetical protein